ncbi:hypothetical protein [Rheinheimera hassiensis]|uniref:hypothetical protein n=1 Tax=Rheinheimera hassiensis TaxID=1193627 RepID=UPI001F065352|nr:hypothetical protein [Rheinheimera hassiensis]
MNLNDRISKIQTVGDAESQIRLAQAYMLRLRADAKKSTMLADKLAMQEKAAAAEKVLRQLRRLFFDIEDAIAAGKPDTSVIT